MTPQSHLLRFDTCVINKIKSNVLKCVLFFVVSQMFFVSGPVVVSPSDTITFQLYLPIPTDSKINIKWWKIKDQPIQEIKCGIKKYLYVQKDNHMHTFEITDAETEDSATYYFSFGGKASNKISVHVDGKYIQWHLGLFWRGRVLLFLPYVVWWNFFHDNLLLYELFWDKKNNTSIF